MNKKLVIPLISIIALSIIAMIFYTANGVQQTPLEKITIFCDDFEAETMKFQAVGSGSVTRSNVMAYSGSYSMNVTALAWDLEEALRQIGAIEYPLPTITLEFKFAMPLTGVKSFAFGLEYCSSHRNTWHRSNIDFLLGTYENGTGVYVPLPGYPSGWDIPDNYMFWHTGSLTVDLANGYYVSCSLDDYTWDLSGIPCYDRTLEGSPVCWGSMYPYFYSWGGTGSTSILVDDVELSYHR